MFSTPPVEAMNEAILLVDGSFATLARAQNVLRKQGYKVRGALDAQRALDSLEEVTPHLILIGLLRSGEVTGPELVRRLRANAATRDATIVMLTEDASENERERAMAAGCDGFVGRAISSDELRVLVAEALTERRRARNQPSRAQGGGLLQCFEPPRRVFTGSLVPSYKALPRKPFAYSFEPRRKRPLLSLPTYKARARRPVAMRLVVNHH